jgi:hypothetical protein
MESRTIQSALVRQECKKDAFLLGYFSQSIKAEIALVGNGEREHTEIL